MSYKEFLEYLEENFEGYETFLEKATEFQEAQNKKKTRKKPLEGRKDTESRK